MIIAENEDSRGQRHLVSVVPPIGCRSSSTDPFSSNSSWAVPTDTGQMAHVPVGMAVVDRYATAPRQQPNQSPPVLRVTVLIVANWFEQSSSTNRILICQRLLVVCLIVIVSNAEDSCSRPLSQKRVVSDRSKRKCQVQTANQPINQPTNQRTNEPNKGIKEFFHVESVPKVVRRGRRHRVQSMRACQ